MKEQLSLSSKKFNSIKDITQGNSFQPLSLDCLLKFTDHILFLGMFVTRWLPFLRLPREFSSVSISYNDLKVLLHLKQISLGARLLITLACEVIYNIAKQVNNFTSLICWAMMKQLSCSYQNQERGGEKEKTHVRQM